MESCKFKNILLYLFSIKEVHLWNCFTCLVKRWFVPLSWLDNVLFHLSDHRRCYTIYPIGPDILLRITIELVVSSSLNFLFKFLNVKISFFWRCF